MLALILLILILGFLIFIHEFGHFISAKKCGAYVYEFALGMGPKIFGFKRKNDPTEYSLRLFPIGGYCSIAGEVSDDEDAANGKKLKKSQFMCNKTKWQRLLIIVAGVCMNFIAGFVILFISGLIWGSINQTSIIGVAPIMCTTYDENGEEIEKECPVYASGIEVGDKIVKINGQRVNTWDKFTLILNLKQESDTYTFEVQKSGTNEIKTYDITPLISKDKEGNTYKTFGLGQSPERKKGIGPALKYAFQKTGSILNTMCMVISNLFTGKLSITAFSGPIGIYSVVGDAAKSSAESVLYLVAYLSLNLGFVNLLPLPVFDGGRLLFLIIEAIRKKKLDSNVENIIYTISFVLIMALMVIITIKDIINLF